MRYRYECIGNFRKRRYQPNWEGELCLREWNNHTGYDDFSKLVRCLSEFRTSYPMEKKIYIKKKKMDGTLVCMRELTSSTHRYRGFYLVSNDCNRYTLVMVWKKKKKRRKNWFFRSKNSTALATVCVRIIYVKSFLRM